MTDSGESPSKRGHVSDDHAGLVDEPQFQRKRLAAERRGERPPAEELRNDDGDEVPFSSREAPHVLEHRIEWPILPRHDFEMGRALELA